YKHILIIRDPRDIAVSLANHYRKFESYRLYSFFKKIKDIDEKLKYTIGGIRNVEENKKLYFFIKIQKLKKALGLNYAQYKNLNLSSIPSNFKRFNRWLNNDNVLTVKFEDLIGEVGGGDLKAQIKTIKQILNYLEIEPKNDLVEYISQNVFWKKSMTFHKGQIGTYRDFFKPEHKKLFKEISGDLLIRLGYEKDNNW
ncbi:sulfotransferase domain-containing protein, partial [Candidatus Dependentiae bacterium]|nr:sulfotransferase domain-containing protein [Candidatus Dependentiae bacterium]